GPGAPRPAARSGERRPLRADASLDRPARGRGRARRRVSSGRRAPGRRRHPRPRRPRFAPAHLGSPRRPSGERRPLLPGRAPPLLGPGKETAMSQSAAEAAARAKALDYFKKRGTLAPIGEVRTRVAAALHAFEEVVEPVDSITAAIRAWDGEWSVHEIADHLLETYRPGLDELWCLLGGRRPPDPPIPARLL